MTDFRLYPRLSPDIADAIRVELIRSESVFEFRPEKFEEALSAAGSFPATGGRRTTENELLDLREECLNAVAFSEGSSSLPTSEFDLQLGRVLYKRSIGSTGEFGNARVWDFLALILLPDIASARFPGTASTLGARFTGGNRRHVLQRLWRRWKVFGDEVVESGHLTEDDYVALLERRLTSERPAVAARAAAAILGSKRTGTSRREFTRVLMRQLVQMSGIVEIGDDDPEHLDALMNHVSGNVELMFQSTTLF